MTADEPDGAGPTVRRMVLGGQLRRLRESAGVTREDAGYAIRASGSKISRLELGRVGFKERDVSDLLTLYGIGDEKEREAFLEMARMSSQPGWWHRYSDLLPSWFHDYVGLEESASRIQSYEVQFVPGLLQTERYARAIAERGLPGAPRAEIDRRVRLRIQRQRVLFGRQAPRLWAVIDESVLHRPIGGADVLRGQIAHLLDVTTNPNVTVQVVPFSTGGSAAEGAFTILRFSEPELPDVVYLEHLGGALYLDKAEDRELYGRTADRLAVEALTPQATRAEFEKRLAAL